MVRVDARPVLRMEPVEVVGPPGHHGDEDPGEEARYAEPPGQGRAEGHRQPDVHPDEAEAGHRVPLAVQELEDGEGSEGDRQELEEDEGEEAGRQARASLLRYYMFVSTPSPPERGQ